VLGIARLDVGFLQLLKHGPLLAVVAGPDVDETDVQPLGLSAQERQIVDVWGLCRASCYAA
jgi:hypothetical protein